jgi:hypothetical protein
MKFLTKIIVMFAITSSCALAQTQSAKETGFYAELGLAQAYYTEPGANFNNSMAVGKLGYSINKYVAAEVMSAFSLNSANFYYGTTYINAKVSSAYGGYGKFSLPINEDASLFLRVGVTNVTVNASSRYGRAHSSGTDLSYGGGFQVKFAKDYYAQADYMSYYDNNGITVTAPSISVGFKF